MSSGRVATGARRGTLQVARVHGVGNGHLVSFKPPRGNLIPFLQERNEVRVWLPPGYETETMRYPVVFCHDGQNMMDAESSWLGISWQLGAAASSEIQRGTIHAPILVLIPNIESLRYMEYEWGGAMNEAFITWMCDVLKPSVDAKFRTLSNCTYALGSSLGGTVSFTSCYLRPDVFKGAACLSPLFSATYITEIALNGRQFRAPGGRCKSVRLYIDNGGDGETDETHVSPVDWENWNEGRGLPAPTKGFFWLDTQFQHGINAAIWAFRFHGLNPGSSSDHRFAYHKFAGHAHNEQAWAKRVPGALRFLLDKASG
eukprot:gnl/MRDRNA2_/MRDRNA2_213599_c0_seq1.p1 gnl/MRDRNA2_/MRDRNA2_213599_c0~~gnl/MRDRNA2_/MRDRNA2_213599_c0_seq1.p1  ORF type:complete len:348 (+),score=28.53 gnl/MRDRNA2_/MRDRNA2_213599_c0_seq1:101-1045(+)